MTDPLDARAFAERTPWFSWLGLLVGVALVVGGGALAFDAFSALRSMPDAPTPCAAAQCPDDRWVRVTDAQWRFEDTLVEGPHAYVPIVPADASPLVLAALDELPAEGARALTAEGVIVPLSSRSPLTERLDASARILWMGHGPGNSLGLVVVGVALVLVGLLCVWFYRRALRARPA